MPCHLVLTSSTEIRYCVARNVSRQPLHKSHWKFNIFAPRGFIIIQITDYQKWISRIFWPYQLFIKMWAKHRVIFNIALWSSKKTKINAMTAKILLRKSTLFAFHGFFSEKLVEEKRHCRCRPEPENSRAGRHENLSENINWGPCRFSVVKVVKCCFLHINLMSRSKREKRKR